MSDDMVYLQSAPYPQDLDDLVMQVSYKEWDFELRNMDRGQGCKGLTLVITARVNNSYHSEHKFAVNHYFPVPPAAFDYRSWCRWLFDCVVQAELHETMEFFKIGEDRPYAPNHGPGRNPYIVHEVGLKRDAETRSDGSYFGVDNDERDAV